MTMVTQKAISVRIDYGVLKSIEQEVSASSHNRNRIIHDALVMYLQWADMCRRINSGSSPNLEINDFYQSYKDVTKRYFRLQS